MFYKYYPLHNNLLPTDENQLFLFRSQENKRHITMVAKNSIKKLGLTAN